MQGQKPWDTHFFKKVSFSSSWCIIPLNKLFLSLTAIFIMSLIDIIQNGALTEHQKLEQINKALILQSAHVGQTDKERETLLHWAVRANYPAITRALIQARANVNQASNDGVTPLHWAAYYGHDVILQILIQANAKVNQTDHKKWSALHWAAQNGHTAIIQALAQAGANVDQTDDEGWAPLHRAVYEGNIDSVQALLQAKADVNLTTTSGWTPLHWAVYMGHFDLVCLLIKAKANLDQVDHDGWRPLHWAIHNGYTDIAQLLRKTAQKRHYLTILKLFYIENIYVAQGLPVSKVCALPVESSENSPCFLYDFKTAPRHEMKQLCHQATREFESWRYEIVLNQECHALLHRQPMQNRLDETALYTAREAKWHDHPEKYAILPYKKLRLA